MSLTKMQADMNMQEPELQAVPIKGVSKMQGMDPQQLEAARAAIQQLLKMGLNEKEIVEMILEMIEEQSGAELDAAKKKKIKQMVKQGASK